MEFQKIVNFIGTNSDNKDLPDERITKKKITVITKKLRLKNQ